MPLVSIIIPAYNCAAHLKDAIESALNQSWQNKEIIVVNDGSKDHSLEIARQFEAKSVLVFTQDNKGASAARNKGVEISKGEWIQFLDADDILSPDKIQTQLSLLHDENEIDVCKTVHFMNEPLKGVADSDEFFEKYLDDPLRFAIKLYGGFDYHSGMIQPNAFLVHRSVINKAGKWNETLSLDDDGEFFCRVLLNCRKIVYTPRPMNYYRKYQSSSSLSGAKSVVAFRSQFDSLRLKHQHLLAHLSDPELLPYIHTATFKQIQLLKHAMYPKYRELYSEIDSFSKTLIKHHSRGYEIYGGAIANFVGNRISWKLLKRLQHLRLAMFSS